MYLHQKFGWEYTHITKDSDLKLMFEKMALDQPTSLGIDTETDGLHHMVARPFLLSFGWNKQVYTLDMSCSKDLVHEMLEHLVSVYELGKFSYLFAHNAKFDFHMLLQYGFDFDFLTKLPWADSITVARLTNYADAEIKMSLESLGKAYVDDDAKMAGTVIKKAITQIKLDQRRMMKATEDSSEPADVNYETVYHLKPNLMLNYAADDIVIMLTYLEKALPLLSKVNPELKTFKRECELIPTIAKLERIGIKVDVEYAERSRVKMVNRRNELQAMMELIVGESFTVGQHAWIKTMFQRRFGITLMKADEKALKKVWEAAKDEDAKTVARCIIELRTIEKWISTYIDGKLNSMVNGRIYTSINNSGAVSGRVSCDMQQQPKEALSDIEGHIIYDAHGEELFHPRRMFVPDEGYAFVFIDYSQMELRVQAYYTMLVMGGDINLCRAYIPFKCYSMWTGEEFDYKKPEVLNRWDSGEWLLEENDEPWVAVDLHDVTTFGAFKELNNDKKHPQFKHYRRWGKMANFLEVYQGGINALIEQLDVAKEIAEKLHNSFRSSYKGIAQYQKWISAQCRTYRFVENLFGRRYYMQNIDNAYKLANYMIQGTCADILKIKELEFDSRITHMNYDAKVILPVHDELMLMVRLDKNFGKVVDDLHGIMQDIPEIPWVPMLSEVEVGFNNWADKKAFGGELNESEYE